MLVIGETLDLQLLGCFLFLLFFKCVEKLQNVNTLSNSLDQYILHNSDKMSCIMDANES